MGGCESCSKAEPSAKESISPTNAVAAVTPLQNEETVIKFLSKVKLFQRLPKEVHTTLANACVPAEYKPKARIISQGDDGDEFFLIQVGEADVEVNGKKVATLKANDYFGETALLRNEPRTATITAKTDLKALKLSRERFDLLGLRERLDFPQRKAVGGGGMNAVQLAAVERGQVEAAVAELQASKLCDEAVHSEVVSSELWQDLAKVEGQDHRRDQLASELRCAQAEHEELRAYIWMQEEYDSELLASLNESEAQKASVSEALQVDALRWEELKSSIRETQDMASRLYAELSEHTKCHSSVKARHSQVEEAGQGRLADLRGQHKEHATEAASLEAKANQLQAESQQLDGDIRKTRQLKEELVQTLATREDEHQAELVRKAELNTELEELKKKWRCAIS